MSNSSKAVVPTGATHKWHAASDTQFLGGTIHRLPYYKFEDGCWWVYGCTGWRKSANGDEWFTKEIIEGFFRPI